MIGYRFGLTRHHVESDVVANEHGPYFCRQPWPAAGGQLLNACPEHGQTPPIECDCGVWAASTTEVRDAYLRGPIVGAWYRDEMKHGAAHVEALTAEWRCLTIEYGGACKAPNERALAHVGGRPWLRGWWRAEWATVVAVEPMPAWWPELVREATRKGAATFPPPRPTKPVDLDAVARFVQGQR